MQPGFFVFLVMQQPVFNKENFISLCDKLISGHRVFYAIKEDVGYPPLWQRPPGFETLMRLILEQQVSLASAQSAYLKLLENRKDITPENMLLMPAEDWRLCYVSRQKTRYILALSEAVVSEELDLAALSDLPDNEVKSTLEKIPGIGNWTSDVYLLLCLNRPDIFPVGDVALRTSMREVMELNADFTSENLVQIAENWRPYRSIATYFFWHHYLVRRKRTTHY